MFVVAHTFGWTRAKWETLPWFDQRMYIEQLDRRGLLDDSDAAPVAQQVDMSEQSAEALAAAGATVRRR